MGLRACCGLKVVAAYTDLILDRNAPLAVSRLSLCVECEYNRRGFCQACPTVVKCWVKAKVRGIDQVCPHPNGQKW